MAAPDVTRARPTYEREALEGAIVRAGAKIVAEAEVYLQFYAELEPRSERAEAEPPADGPRCERCGASTPWRMYECPGCRGLR